MSHIFRNKAPEVHYGEYLKHKDEPKEEDLNRGASSRPDVALIRSTSYHKLKIRHRARELRFAQAEDLVLRTGKDDFAYFNWLKPVLKVYDWLKSTFRTTQTSNRI